MRSLSNRLCTLPRIPKGETRQVKLLTGARLADLQQNIFYSRQIMKKIITDILEYVVMLLITSLVIMILWNWLMPIIFGMPKITYGMSIGVDILSRQIFNRKTL